MNPKIENQRGKYCEENGIDYKSLLPKDKRKLTNKVKELMTPVEITNSAEMPGIKTAPVPEPKKVQERVVPVAPIEPPVVPVVSSEPEKEPEKEPVWAGKLRCKKGIVRFHFAEPNGTYILPLSAVQDEELGLTPVTKRPQNAYLRARGTAYLDMSIKKDRQTVEYMRKRRGYGTKFYIINDDEKSAETIKDMADSIRELTKMSVFALHSLFTDVDYNQYQLSRSETDKAVLTAIAIKAGKVLK